MIRWQLLFVIYSSFVSASYVEKKNEENEFKLTSTWELGRGKYFNVKLYTSEEENKNSSKFSLDTKEAFQDTFHFYLFGTEILLRKLSELRYKKMCEEDEIDVCEHPWTALDGSTSTYTIILYDENNEPKEIKFRTIFQTSVVDIFFINHYTYEISDNQNNHFWPIFKMKNCVFGGLAYDGGRYYIEIPLLSTTIKLSIIANDYPNSKVKMIINNGTGFVDYRSEGDLHNASLDNLFGNERVSKIRENAIKSIFLSQDVPESYKEEEQTFQFKSEKLNVFFNLTTSEIKANETEIWTLLEAESSQWPQLNFVWNMLQMRQNDKTQYGAGFGKSSWNQATWREYETYGTDHNTYFVFTTHFNSDFPIASAVLKIDDLYSTGELILDSQETQWILKFENLPRGYSVTLFRTDIWTQNVRPITLLEIKDENLEFPKSDEQTSKLVISHYRNFKSFVETMSDSFSKLQVDKALHALWKDRLLAKVLDVLAVAFGGTLREDLMKEVDHLESFLKEAVTVLSKKFINLVEEKSEELEAIFIKSLRSIGGDYIEQDDQIVMMYNSNSLVQKLPSVISKELSAHYEQL